MKEMRNTQLSSENLNRRNHLEDLCVDGAMIILKWLRIGTSGGFL
jgi:hypothetical protein